MLNIINNFLKFYFYRCYWHGCPKCFRYNRDEELSGGVSLDKKFEKTYASSIKIKSLNYKLIEIWEHDFDDFSKNNERLKRFLKEKVDLVYRKPLNPRDALFGGRTGNTVKVYDCRENEKIRYLDYCSLYPYICKRSKYPVGHPKLYIGENECRLLVGDNNDISNVNGLVMCKVLPPRNLYHPVLPVKMHDKLLFPLCRTCAEQMIQQECNHEDPEDREFIGTWVSEELKKAVELGYAVVSIYEIWQYNMTQYDPVTKTGGIFAEYIDAFFTLKTQASGYPPDCTTEEDKEKYISEFEKTEGIKVDKNSINFNPGKRLVAKLGNNSIWGKFAQAQNKQQTIVLNSASKLFELLHSKEIIVNSILPVNDETLYVGWSYKSEALAPSGSTNVVVAAFTTAQARLKLYECLQVLGARVLYFDTDSVFYVSKPGMYDLPTGSMLGELTDELADKGVGTYISRFLSGGPKFYAFEYVKPDGTKDYVCKIKGIRLNFSTKQKLNFESIRGMIMGESEKIVVESSSIQRTAFHDVITLRTAKICKPVYSKRRFEGLEKSYPYGFKM